MINFLVKEANSQIKKDCSVINKYILKSNIKDYNIKGFEFKSNGVKRIVTFEVIDYYKFIDKSFAINEPYGYFEFKYNEARTHFYPVKFLPAFEYVLLKENEIGKKLLTDNILNLNLKDQLIIIACVRKEN